MITGLCIDVSAPFLFAPINLLLEVPNVVPHSNLERGDAVNLGFGKGTGIGPVILLNTVAGDDRARTVTAILAVNEDRLGHSGDCRQDAGNLRIRWSGERMKRDVCVSYRTCGRRCRFLLPHRVSVKTVGPRS